MTLFSPHPEFLGHGVTLILHLTVSFTSIIDSQGDVLTAVTPVSLPEAYAHRPQAVFVFTSLAGQVSEAPRAIYDMKGKFQNRIACGVKKKKKKSAYK